MLRRFEPSIAEKTFFLNKLTSSFNWGGEEEIKFGELKELLKGMLENPVNFRPDPTFPLIIEVDASNSAIGAALIQEINQERILIYSASRSLKSAETRYSTIRRELLGVVFAVVKKFRRFVLGRKFIVRTDHRPLLGLVRKPLAMIENEDLRDLVAKLAPYNFEMEYVVGAENIFPDWLSRNCIEELYEYPSFRLTTDKKGYEVFSKSLWRRFVPAVERRSLLVSIYTNRHYGYTKMINEALKASFIWPNISESIREFLADCGCSVAKNNRRKGIK